MTKMANGETKATAAAERLDASEMAYHAKVLASLQWAHQQVRDAETIRDAWQGHLTEKYGLADGSTVTVEGTILRPPAPAESPEEPTT